MRDRLIELLTPSIADVVDNRKGITELADYLLANGVIVPHCKVGDKVYRTSGNYFGEKIFEGVVAQISIYNNGEIRFWEHGHPLSFTPNDFGKTVFLSREEAEQKLKEGCE